jgi:hypothetical protein
VRPLEPALDHARDAHPQLVAIDAVGLDSLPSLECDPAAVDGPQPEQAHVPVFAVPADGDGLPSFCGVAVWRLRLGAFEEHDKPEGREDRVARLAPRRRSVTAVVSAVVAGDVDLRPELPDADQRAGGVLIRRAGRATVCGHVVEVIGSAGDAAPSRPADAGPAPSSDLVQYLVSAGMGGFATPAGSAAASGATGVKVAIRATAAAIRRLLAL